eukprot:2705696-Rhodomonas_salina.10
MAQKILEETSSSWRKKYWRRRTIWIPDAEPDTAHPMRKDAKFEDDFEGSDEQLALWKSPIQRVDHSSDPAQLTSDQTYPAYDQPVQAAAAPKGCRLRYNRANIPPPHASNAVEHVFTCKGEKA